MSRLMQLRRLRRVRRKAVNGCAASCAAVLLSACVSFPEAPRVRASPQVSLAPHEDAPLVSGSLISVDGAALALDVWPARGGEPRAVILALHAMNDYARAFDAPARWWAVRGVTTYAYDQRGFGRRSGDLGGEAALEAGRWPGAATLVVDLRAALVAVRAAHPGAPVYVLGHSMGGAVALAAMADAPLEADGVILAAPAVWGGSRLPAFYRLTANIAASLAPGKKLSGRRAGRQATDNIEALRLMAADPNVLKETRLDAVLGLIRLMGEAWDASDEVGGRALLLFGERDELLPPRVVGAAADRLCGDVEVRRYADGWHLLFRDLQAERVWRDVAAWIMQSRRGVEQRAAPRESQQMRTRRDASEDDPQARLGWVGPADLMCGHALGEEQADS